MSFIYKPMPYIFKGTQFKMDVESLFTTLAFIFFTYWVIRQLKKENLVLKGKDLFWFLFAAIFGSLAGGRLYYYIEHWKGLQTLITLFDLSKPGLVSVGMIIGGIASIVLFVYFYNRDNKVEKDWKDLFSRYIDILGPATALFVFIYRLGCFHFGDVPGTAADPNLPWAMFALYYGKYTGITMHPTALYLSFSALLIFIFLHYYSKRKKFTGEVGLLFIFFYSFNRFWIEFLRAGSERYLGMNQVQWIGIAAVLLSLTILLINYLRHYKRIPDKKYLGFI